LSNANYSEWLLLVAAIIAVTFTFITVFKSLSTTVGKIDYMRSHLCEVRFKICPGLDVFTNSVAKRCVDYVPLVYHLGRRLAQHLVD